MENTLVQVPDFRLIARDPQELEASRMKLIEFFDAKIRAIEAEEADLEKNMEIATKFPIRMQPITAALNRAKKRRIFYEKAKAAVEAGFHIIPNFNADIFAVRTHRAAPSTKQVDGLASYGGPRLPAQRPSLAPAGEGRYVGPQAGTYREATYSSQENGKEEKRIARWATSFEEEIDFPFALARAEVLDATRHVMALKIFDELGALPNQRRNADPMVVGIIRDGNDRNAKLMTFLVVWFLDTATL